jgi:allophanate hydrolase subunit 2
LRGQFGGFEGRALRRGDRIEHGSEAASAHDFGVVPPHESLRPQIGQDGAVCVRAIAAGEFPEFTEEACDALWGTSWTISPQSNRSGYRLTGTALMLARPLEMRSHGIVPGVVQVPPNGQPIIQLADANVSGGYPKIATVISADLWRLGQAPLGSCVRFVQSTRQEALDALIEIEKYVDAVTKAAMRVRQHV